jgi:hypothetical protein
MFEIIQVNDVPADKVDFRVAVAEAEGAIQVYKFKQVNGKFTIIVVRNRT